jgi:hypothetical protein
VTEDFQNLEVMTAAQIHEEMQQLAENLTTAKFRAAALVARMDTMQGWTRVGFKTKDAWLKAILPDRVSKSLVYKTVKQLTEHVGVPVSELEQIPEANLDHIKKLPARKQNDPEVIEAAKRPEREFVKLLNEEYNLNIALPGKVILHFDDAGEAEEVIRGIDNLRTIPDFSGMTRGLAVRSLLEKAGAI